jgi:peptidoglycan/LPS O-acetylase OafA/YrhL
LYLQNWLFIFKTPDPSTFLNHYWSLGVEEQFYIIWPVLIVLIRNTKKLSRILLGGLILVASTRIVLFLFPVPKLNYYNFHTFSRIDGLLAGSMLAIYLQSAARIPRKLVLRIIIGLLLLNGIFLLVNIAFPFHFPYFPFAGYTTFSIAFALLVYLIIIRKDQISFFNHQALRFLGEISYGLYLYHWPIYLIAFPKLQTICGTAFNMSAEPSNFTAAILCSLAAILISFLSYRFIESKFLAFKKYASYQTGKKEVLTTPS